MSKRVTTLVQEYAKAEIGINLRVTENQRDLIEAIHESDMTIAVGDAGTGKTMVALAAGLAHILHPELPQENIVYVRPAVQSQEDLGFLPGSASEKVDPYMAPFWHNARRLLPKKQLMDIVQKEKSVELTTFAFLRGRTFEKAIVILDEAQNCTVTQMKLLLTRLGRNSKVIIVGDIDQSDIDLDGPCGLRDAIYRFHPEVAELVELGPEDNFRSPLVQKILRGYKQNITVPRRLTTGFEDYSSGA